MWIRGPKVRFIILVAVDLLDAHFRDAARSKEVCVNNAVSYTLAKYGSEDGSYP